MPTTEAFQSAYTGLNEAQKKAVDTVEGPVLVIAGPGTGKTHILTLRIANILAKTQATPENILALTFTDSAARTIRERLGRLMGDRTARDVHVFTFHGFCNYVLESYPDYFPEWAGKRQAGAVEGTLLWREVLETSEVTLLRTPKSAFHALRDLEKLYGSLIRERVTLDAYRAWVAEEEARIRADETLCYVRDSKYGKKGELKPEGQKKIDRLQKVFEAARLIEAYETLKERRDVYDFNDVLRGVVDRLQADEALRATLQEKFQYILADEHQDANAYQHALLDAFAYDEHPNLFVVGDEKQAIFRFQGADSTHFRAFMEKYPRTELIRLVESRRSLQGILDIAHTLAVEKIPATHEAHAPLKAYREGQAQVSVLVAPDPLAERDQVASLIETAIAGGTAPEEIAVITAKNQSANLMAEHLAGRKIPTLRAGDISLESRPFMRAFLALLSATADPLDTASLRLSLLAPWWGMPLTDRAHFLLRTRDSELAARLQSTFPDVAKRIEKLQQSAQSEAPLQVFSRVLTESGAQSFALSHPEHLEDIPLVRMLYEYFEQVVVRNPSMSFGLAMEAIRKAHEHDLEWVQTSVLQKKGHVSVITAHKAKGMEFERVFVTGLTESEWERGRVSSIPSPVDFISSAEDAVKKFYVAVTRAKDELVLSYAAGTLDGKAIKTSGLVPEGLPEKKVPHNPLPVLHSDIDAPELVKTLTRAYLEGDGLFPTALEDYLESPPTFFARRVLKLREPEQPSMLIGNAVHAGIAGFIKHGTEEAAFSDLERALYVSMLPRDEVYASAAQDARLRLKAFLEGAATLGTPEASEKVYTTRHKVGEQEVGLAGKLDALYKRDGVLRVIDFKTSGKVKGKEKDFALQLAYYDMLLRANDINVSGASIVQVRADGIEEFPVPITDETRAELLTTLNVVLTELLSGQWRKGEPSEYDDLLELFR